MDSAGKIGTHVDHQKCQDKQYHISCSHIFMHRQHEIINKNTYKQYYRKGQQYWMTKVGKKCLKDTCGKNCDSEYRRNSKYTKTAVGKEDHLP